MLRLVSKLQQPIQWVVFNITKQYGTRAQSYIEMTDAAKSSTIQTSDLPESNEKHEKHFIYKRQTSKTLHFNVEELTEALQKVYVERQLEEIMKTVEDNEIRKVTFNFVHENVFRCQLNMPIRKLGFDSSFQRYNNDRGLAIFSKKSGQEISMDNSNMGSYNRRAYAQQFYGLS